MDLGQQLLRFKLGLLRGFRFFHQGSEVKLEVLTVTGPHFKRFSLESIAPVLTKTKWGSGSWIPLTESKGKRKQGWLLGYLQQVKVAKRLREGF